jgi:hypothetical protein
MNEIWFPMRPFTHGNNLNTVSCGGVRACVGTRYQKILSMIIAPMSKRKADSIETVEVVEAAATAEAVQSVEDFVPHRARDAPEIWKVIPGFPGYEASSKGNLRTIRTGKTRKSYVNKGGYQMVSLRLDGKLKGKLTGSLVLSAFVGASTGDQTVDHVNRNRVDDNLANLRWATKVEQSANRNKPSKLPATQKPVIVTSSLIFRTEFAVIHRKVNTKVTSTESPNLSHG